MNEYVIYDQDKEKFWCWVKKELKRRSTIKYFASREIDDKIPFWTNDFEHARVLNKSDFFNDNSIHLAGYIITLNIFDMSESMAFNVLKERKDHLILIPIIDGEPCFDKVEPYE